MIKFCLKAACFVHDCLRKKNIIPVSFAFGIFGISGSYVPRFFIAKVLRQTTSKLLLSFAF